MKLSEILSNFYVVPLNQSELVSYISGEEDLIRITWTDSDGNWDYEQEFEDQDIVLAHEDHGPGAFLVTDIYDETVGFIALVGATPEQLQ